MRESESVGCAEKKQRIVVIVMPAMARKEKMPMM